MDRKPFLKQIRVDNVDAITKHGEHYTAQKKFQIVEEDNAKFLLMFHHISAFMNGLDSLVDVKLMNWISDNMNYNDSIIMLDKYYKQKAAEYVGFSYSAVEKSISSLTAKGFLVKHNCKRCARYHVNPSYIWYGDKAVRDGKLKFVLELMQYQDLPDREQEILDDIERASEHYKNQQKSK